MRCTGTVLTQWHAGDTVLFRYRSRVRETTRTMSVVRVPRIARASCLRVCWVYSGCKKEKDKEREDEWSDWGREGETGYAKDEKREIEREEDTRFMRGGGVGGVGTFCSHCWTSPS